MNGDVEVQAPRPRPLSAGIWTLFSWLRRTDRSLSSESVSSVGSDRTVASFDFLAPLNYKHADTALVLPQDPLTETYKKRLHERNLRRQHDRDITLRRKYGLFREEGFVYDAFSLPLARRFQKDSGLKQDRERRATSESIQRRSAYVPGKRRAPLPPIVVASATLPRNHKRKRPAPKPPVKISEDNKENVEINKIVQMNASPNVDKNSNLSKETSSNITEKHSKLETKETKLRADKSFLRQIFDGKKRNSAIDTSRIKLLPSISELDKQAAEIIEANKALRASGYNADRLIDSGVKSTTAEETWTCTACFRKYKPVVTCCIYCIIKENSKNKTGKNISTNTNMYTQIDENALKSSRKHEIDDKKKLREMLKEMKDSLPKRPKHNDKYSEDIKGDIVNSTEPSTLRIGATVDEIVKASFDAKSPEKVPDTKNVNNYAKEKFLNSEPSSSKESPIKLTSNEAHVTEKSAFESASLSNPLPIQSLSNPKSPGNLFQNVPLLKLPSKKEYPHCNEANKVERGATNSTVNYNTKVTNEINESSALKNIRIRDSSNLEHDIKITDEKLDNKLQKNLKDIDEFPAKNTPIHLGKESSTDTPSNIVKSKIFANDTNQYTVPLIQKPDNAGIKDKVERIPFGNVYSSKIVNIDKTETGVTSNSSTNKNLYLPLKVSSLLNPLYCPKYKTSNSKVIDCNFAKGLSTTATVAESYKKEEASHNEPKILPKMVSTVAMNMQIPSSSNPKLLKEVLEKSETSKMLTQSNVKDFENEFDLERKNSDNVPPEDIPNTVNVNNLDQYDRRRNLINQLEQAISKGDEQLAAEAAAKLAKLKLACSVLSFSSQIVAEVIPVKKELLQNNISNAENETEQMNKPVNKVVAQKPRKETDILLQATASTSSPTPDDKIPIEVCVEDKEAARGPIPLRISRKATIGELKRHVEISLGLEIRFQRWIVGRTLCTDDSTPLVFLAGPNLNAPFYLCLVESESNKDIATQIKDITHNQIKPEPSEINNAASGDVYTELMKLERQALVPNTEEFECGVCIENCPVGAGVVLRECIHTFCRECLADVIRHCEEPVVACPAVQCPGEVQEREIRAILSTEEYERWLARGLAAAESGTRNTFHCRTRDCKGWAFCEPEVRRFPCPVCKHTNCVPCQAVHEGDTCDQYQTKLHEVVTAAESNQADEGTQALLKSLISRGEALECPECSAIITKKWGCDWVKCSACKTEICWVTKGRRWGPGGKGDTSGGCKCGVDGKRCHPSCGYCH